jgi:hypothetical protein
MSSIVEAVIRSTDHYLHHLEEKGGGVKNVDATKKSEQKPELQYVNGRALLVYTWATDPGLALDQGQEVTYLPRNTGDRILSIVVDYDRSVGTLELGFEEEQLSIEGNIEIDFKWLIRRTRAWFSANGSKISRPPWHARPVASTGPSLEVSRLPTLSAAQLSAVEACIQSGFVYVWGPPGTGKTKHVLASTALVLVRSGKRTLVLAPTNNAVDNALQAILDSLGEVARRSDVIRLGTPTARFLENNPDVCEDKHVRDLLVALQRDIDHYHSQIETLKELQRLKVSLHIEQERLRESLAKAESARKQAESISDRIIEIADDIGEKENGVAALLLDEARLQIEASSLNLLEKLLGTPRKRRIIAKLAQLTLEINSARRAIGKAKELSSVKDREKEKFLALMANCSSTATKCEAKIRKLELAINDHCSLIADFQPSDPESALAHIQTEVQKLTIKKRTIELDLTGKRIIAMTLDGFIGRSMQMTFAVDHVLIDEAAYAPLAKFLPLLSLHAPISLFGDHLQLPPICEADDHDALSQSYWGNSALFLEEAWNRPFEFDALLALQLPAFRQLPIAPLPHSHRYGTRLAEVLRRHVYRGLDLTGEEGRRTKIEHVDVKPRLEPGNKWVNGAEVDAVSQIVKGLVEEGVTDIAVLTPYKNQSKEIFASLRSRRLDRFAEVLNTHKAQGREWENVIFSVVETGREGRPFLTNSQNMKGLLVLNTTISRAKSRLWILADGRYWTGKDQLISDLIAIAQRRELS